MNSVSISEAKMKLSSLVERIRLTNEEVVITRNGRPAAVLISPDEYAGWRETGVIRSDSDLMAEINDGLAALKENKASLYSLEELFEQDSL